MTWWVHEELWLAVLDRRVMAVAARWPALTDVLFRRLFRRTRALAFSLAMSQQRGIDRRLLVLFWEAANRWGRVTPDGVRVRLPLTHQTLGHLVGSRRPSVSVALGALAARGELVRDGNEWLLRGAPPTLDGAAADARFGAARLAPASRAPVGLTIAVRQAGGPIGKRQRSAANSSSLSSICSAARLSFRCASESVPGIGSTTGERRSIQASVICSGVAPWRSAIS